jgi:hypothetical protein
MFDMFGLSTRYPFGRGWRPFLQAFWGVRAVCFGFGDLDYGSIGHRCLKENGLGGTAFH